jgi:actin-related protein
VPTLSGNILASGVRRLDYAGKLLTKLLIQSISLRQVKLHEHYLAAEHAKEEMCYVALDFKEEIKKSSIPMEYYALPDADIKMRGFRAATRDENHFHQYIQLAHERFVVPEHLFNPAM